MAKKKVEPSQELESEAPLYKAEFAKEFPHLENNKNGNEEELVEAPEEALGEDELLNVGGYKSEHEIEEEIEHAAEEVQRGFFSKLFKKEPKKKLAPEELSRVSAIIKKGKKVVGKPIQRETNEGIMIIQPPGTEVVKRKEERVREEKSIFEIKTPTREEELITISQAVKSSEEFVVKPKV